MRWIADIGNIKRLNLEQCVDEKLRVVIETLKITAYIEINIILMTAHDGVFYCLECLLYLILSR